MENSKQLLMKDSCTSFIHLSVESVSALFLVKVNGRDRNDYTKTIQMIQLLREKLSLNIFNRNVTFKADFKKTAINGITNYFSNVKFTGYYFTLASI